MGGVGNTNFTIAVGIGNGELPDDEFEQICVSFKKELKARADYVIKQKRNRA